MSIEPYTISVPEDALEKLSQRLALTTFPSQFEGEDPWQFGSPVAEVQRIVNYWKDGFDWRRAESKLNELPQFMTPIEVEGFGALNIHFIHQVSPVAGAIPLLFSHGWPGSFIEVTKLLPLLNGKHGSPAFHVVAPSLPNYAFSDGVRKRGFTISKYAETFHKLMLKLGYTSYVTQGGDWGSAITRVIGLKYPEHCMASHLNLILAQPPKITEQPGLALQDATTSYNERETKGFARSEWFQKEGYGYNSLQSSKPQTIGFALADSPVALLSWILEKMHDWTDKYPWTDDEILTWISIYWFSTAGPASSVRIYYEATHPEGYSDVNRARLRGWIPHVKLGLAHFPQEIHVVPKSWGHTLGPVVFQSEHERGGHFAAWEVPKALAGDLQKMFGKDGPCYGIIEGKTGY